MYINNLDYVWISFIVIVNVLFFMRKFIVISYDHGIKISSIIFDIGYDRKRLKEIAKQQASDKKRFLFMTINLLIPVLFIIGIVIAIISVKFFHPNGLLRK